MIEVHGISKRYGDTLAVDDLTFTVTPGTLTGFLGPNGSGKSTTMRMILGLDAPTSGRALVNGRPLADHDAPLAQIGALLDAKAMHPKRSAYDHLLALAVTNGLPASRVEAVLEQVGLSDVAKRGGGGFSLGMGQRLGIAAALLGDPPTVMLDEPVNGLDPEGILWIRHLLQGLAAEGRTVLVSSHLMSEMALMADHFVIIGQGRLIADVSTEELRSMAPPNFVTVRAERLDDLVAPLRQHGGTVESIEQGAVRVVGIDARAIGRIAASEGIALDALVPEETSLEEMFIRMTQSSVQYHGSTSTNSTSSANPTHAQKELAS